MSGLVQGMSVSASVFTLVAIAVERYVGAGMGGTWAPSHPQRVQVSRAISITGELLGMSGVCPSSPGGPQICPWGNPARCPSPPWAENTRIGEIPTYLRHQKPSVKSNPPYPPFPPPGPDHPPSPGTSHQVPKATTVCFPTGFAASSTPSGRS